jgi:hypothetical protein
MVYLGYCQMAAKRIVAAPLMTLPNRHRLIDEAMIAVTAGSVAAGAGRLLLQRDWSAVARFSTHGAQEWTSPHKAFATAYAFPHRAPCSVFVTDDTRSLRT